MKTFSKLFLGVSVMTVTVAGAYFLFNGNLLSREVAATASPPKVIVQSAPLARETKVATSFANVVKKVSPSVVTIYIKKEVKNEEMQDPFADNPFFRRFFDEQQRQGRQGRNRQPQSHQERGLGSGVIVSADGYILTNNHVVEDADEILVTLPGSKEEYTAKVIGRDAPTDVAVIKIDAKGLPAATLSDSDNLEVGDVVLAIGNPFGVGQTVTMGIVSAKSRGVGILGDGGYEDFIQTDASINPGNSGGALVDAEGRVVGVNTAILSRSGGNQGIGFAIPINLARMIMDRITTDGHVVRGYLGVLIQPVTKDLAKMFKLPSENGALVGEVTPKSPAAEAGLQNGDVIVEFNGHKVEDSRTLRLMASQTAPKTTVPLEVIRDGKTKSLKVTLGELPSDLAANKDSHDTPAVKQNDSLDGVEVTDLEPKWRHQFKVPVSVKGALVTNVDADSTSAAAGLKPGDVILEINRQPVRNADDAVRLTEKTGDHVLLRVWTPDGNGSGNSRFLVVDDSKAKK